MKLAFGNTIVEIGGNHPIVGHVHEELSALAVTEGEPTLSFELTSGEPPSIPRDAVVVGPVSAIGATAWIRYPGGFNLQWNSGRGSSHATCYLSPTDRGIGRPHWLRRWRDRTFLAPIEQKAYAFINGVLESGVLFFSKDTALLHSACMEKGGRALLLAGAGGVGKTSTCLRLSLDREWRYLSDDITPLPQDGCVRFYPRKMMFYAYNAQGNRALESALLRSRSLSDRAHWHLRKRIYGPNGARRRVSLVELLGEASIGEASKVQVALFVSRQDVPEFQSTVWTAEELASGCRHIIATEYFHYLNLLHWWEATGHAPVSVLEVLDRQQRIYESAFEKAHLCALLRIPTGCEPKDVASFCDELARQHE